MQIFIIDTDKGTVLVEAASRQDAYRELWAAGYGIAGLVTI